MRRMDVRLDRIIVRAAASTICAIALLLGLLFGILALAFPQTMMDFTYSLGMDKASINYAITSYARFQTIDYIAMGADTALRAKLYDKADECIERLITDENFDKFCEQKNQSILDAEELQGANYQAYYLRQLCIAKYRSGKTQAAIDRAVGLISSGFSSGNPLVAVLAEAKIDGVAGVSSIEYAVHKMTILKSSDVYGNYSEADKAYFDQIFATATKWLDGSES